MMSPVFHVSKNTVMMKEKHRSAAQQEMSVVEKNVMLLKLFNVKMLSQQSHLNNMFAFLCSTVGLSHRSLNLHKALYSCVTAQQCGLKFSFL